MNLRNVDGEVERVPLRNDPVDRRLERFLESVEQSRRLLADLAGQLRDELNHRRPAAHDAFAQPVDDRRTFVQQPGSGAGEHVTEPPRQLLEPRPDAITEPAGEPVDESDGDRQTSSEQRTGKHERQCSDREDERRPTGGDEVLDAVGDRRDSVGPVEIANEFADLAGQFGNERRDGAGQLCDRGLHTGDEPALTLEGLGHLRRDVR